MATLSVAAMRGELYKAYPGYKWWAKVKKMGDNQVVAVYTRLLQSGKIK